MPNTDRYAWLTDQRDQLSSYLSLLGDPDMVRCLPWLMSGGFTITFTADYLAKNAGISAEKAEELMERAAEQQIVRSMITHIGNREVRIYQFEADHMLTAVLTLAHLSLPNQEKNGHIYFNCPTCLNIAREEIK